jgi:osmoprotectant transport system ATP-binding protein
MIALNHVTKSFGARKVLDDISLNFEAGKTHVLLGSSGCGKSTMLRLIIGLSFPDSGEIIVNKIGVSPATQAQIPLHAGYVIQDGGLFPHLTAHENVALAASSAGWSRDRTTARLRELSELVGLSQNLFGRYPKQLSGGQGQRVGLMRALLLDPEILLLDEPLAALDPIVRYSLQTELKRVFNSLKKTVIIVTHDIGEAAFFGHTVTLLDQGRVVQTGSFREIIKNPATDFVREFIMSQRPPPDLQELL